MNEPDLRRPPLSAPSEEAGDDPMDDPRVVAAVEEYLAELEAGRIPDRAALLRRVPELAEAVRACLDGVDLVRAGASVRLKKSSVAGVSARDQELPAAADPAFAGKPLGDFRIVREIARGGMGVVYEAEQLSLGRRVALKVLPFAATVDPRQLQRFKIESQAAALLHHTHIVPIYALGCERGVHFYAMQLIEGQSLAVVVHELRQREGRNVRRAAAAAAESGTGAKRHESPEPAPSPLPKTRAVDAATRMAGGAPSSSIEVVERNGVAAAPARSSSSEEVRFEPLEDPAAASTMNLAAALTKGGSVATTAYVHGIARLMIQAAEALEHAHQAGVVHRDVKPGNLLLDARGSLWVTDFGLAQLQSDNGLTRSGDVLGTFRYMSPEQTGGQRTLLDHRTDVYSLGATFYELLALEPAFSGETHHELLYQILHTEPRRLRELNRAVSPELETILQKAMSKSPADRYRTAAEFAADVQRHLDHQPIHARRPSLLDRAGKWCRRHPTVVAAAVLVMFVTAATSLVSRRLVSLEQEKTAAALEREKLRAAEAELRFRQARDAVDALFQISEEELSDRPGFGARKRILEVVLGHYQEFIDQRQGDAASQAELAQVQEKVKGILHQLEVLHRDMHIRLVANRQVRKDLGLTEPQVRKVETLLESWNKEPAGFAFHPGESDAARRARQADEAEARERSLAAVLTPAQFTRLGQISLQIQGLFVFKDPEVVKHLKLTRVQRDEVRSLEREMLSNRGPREGGGSHRFERFLSGPGGPPDRGFGERGFGGRSVFDRPPGERPLEERPGGERIGEPSPGELRPGERRPDRPSGDPEPPFGEFGGPKPPRDGKERGFGPPFGPLTRREEKEWIARAVASFSEEQQAAWRELIGPPFDESSEMDFHGPGAGVRFAAPPPP